jgi:hypothetical protein
VAAKYIKILAEKHKLRMPISTSLYQILGDTISGTISDTGRSTRLKSFLS